MTYPYYDPVNDKIAPAPTFWKSNGGTALIIVGGIALIISTILFFCCGLPIIGSMLLSTAP